VSQRQRRPAESKLDCGGKVTAHYLLKTEASEYSFADLVRDKETVWDGVANPVALRNLRGMSVGDKLVVYETGDVKSAVGTASVVSVQAEDGKDPRVKIKGGKPLPRTVPLAEIKANKLFVDSPLVRQGRLSVVPLSEQQYRYITGQKE
jgi:predicted RNA-binding protein with PUA-like domain